MYILEGNVGAGKSTLLQLIGNHLPHVQVIHEPVDTWSKEGSGNWLLSHFYQDSSRWGYTMETYTLFMRVQEHVRVAQLAHPYKLMERSLYSGNYCFARNGFDSGVTSQIEWDIYSKWFDFLVTQRCPTPQGFIYLRVEPELCYARSKKRNRSGEESIPLAYFKKLHEQHDNFLLAKKNINETLKSVPVLVLDGSPEFETNPIILQNYLDKIDLFIQ